MEFRICAAIVSYGNRFHLLKQVLDYCREADIYEIVLIDNGISSDSKAQLLAYLNRYPKPVHLSEMGRNTGSAPGFKMAIEQACSKSSEYILLLDDDNLPQPECLNLFQSNWQQLSQKTSTENLILLANRIDRSNFKKVITSRNPMDMLQPKNHFLGFHWGAFGEKLIERILSPKIKENDGQAKPCLVAAAPYSGMFFHRNLIAKNGLPREDYVLYMDDFEFSHRIFQNKGQIYLLADCIIDDLESSVYLPKKKGFFYHSLFEGNETPMFYAYRNMLVFSNQYLLSNRLIYTFNKYSFLLMIRILALLNGKWSKLKVLKDATYAGENNILGENSNYPLS